MATKLKKAAAAALVIEHGGQEYRLSPLTVADLGELELWAQTLPIERARRRIVAWGDDISPELQADILREAEKQAADITAMTVDFASIEATAYLLYLSLHKTHPDITRAAAASLIQPKDLETWQGWLDKVSGMSGDGDADPTPGKAEKPEAENPSTGAPSTAR